MSLSVLALHRLVCRHVVNRARDDGNECVRIVLRAHEQTALPSFLVGRLVHRHGRRRDDIFIVDIRHHADDLPWLGADADKLHHPVRPPQIAVQRFLPGKQRLRNAPADDHHALRSVPVGVPEIAAFQNRYSQRFEESR
jgi:hypothetical protein